MKFKLFLTVVVIILLAYYAVNIKFKVNYANNNVATIDNLEINDSIKIPKAYIVLGRNYKGFIEATVFPAREFRYNDKGIVEYYYLRFHPAWFKTHIVPRIINYLEKGDKLAFDLVHKAKIAHEDNFDYCCHFNDYPLVDKNLLFVRISLLGVADKVTMLAKANSR